MTDSIVIDVDAGTAACNESGLDSIAGFEVVIGGQNDDTFLIAFEGYTDDLTLTGGGGDDTYALSFETTADGLAVRAFQITDFGPGDVVTAGQDRYRSGSGHSSDQSMDYTAAAPATTLRAAEVQHETRGDFDYTILQIANAEGDDVFEITLNGYLDIWIDQH